MSYIITDDKHYKAIAKSLRSKMQTNREYYPEDMAAAVDNIPSSADGTDNPIIGIYFLNPDENGYPTKIKVSGWSLENKETKFPIVFSDKMFSKVESVEFLNCNFKYLSDSVFKNIKMLKTVCLPQTILELPGLAFYDCTSLTSITIPNGVTSLGSSVFSGCSSLTSINIPDGVIILNYGVFNRCTSLTSITIPGSVTSLGNEVFSDCKKLEFVELGQGFNANNLNLSASKNYSRETILQWLNALADRTGETAYKLTIGKTNLAKLTEEDIAIATAKNWTLA